MAARYQERRARLVAAVDRRYAENMQFVPKSGATQYSKSEDDGTREGFNIEGCLRVAGKGNDTGGDRRNFQSRIHADGATLSIDHNLIPAGTVFKKHDVFKALDRTGEPKFEVLEINDNQITRLVLQLGEL